MPDFLIQALRPASWPAFVLISTRLGGLMLAAPLWSMTALPRPARAAITVLLAILLLPGAPRVTLPDQWLDLPLPLAMEFIVGLAIGLTAAVVVQGAALAGEVISLQMSLSLGPALLPTPDMQVSGVGQIQSALALLIYVSVGGHTMLLQGLADSLRTLPPGMPMSLQGGATGATMLAGTLFSSALRAAAPVMVALLLANLALAILSRAVPHLNAMMVSFPIVIALGLVTLGASLSVVAPVIERWMHGIPGQVQEVLQSFQPVLR